MKKDSNAIILTVKTKMEMTLWDCIKFRIAGLHKCEEWNKYLSGISSVLNKSVENVVIPQEGTGQKPLSNSTDEN